MGRGGGRGGDRDINMNIIGTKETQAQISPRRSPRFTFSGYGDFSG